MILSVLFLFACGDDKEDTAIAQETGEVEIVEEAEETEETESGETEEAE